MPFATAPDPTKDPTTVLSACLRDKLVAPDTRSGLGIVRLKNPLRHKQFCQALPVYVGPRIDYWA